MNIYVVQEMDKWEGIQEFKLLAHERKISEVEFKEMVKIAYCQCGANTGWFPEIENIYHFLCNIYGFQEVEYTAMNFDHLKGVYYE